MQDYIEPFTSKVALASCVDFIAFICELLMQPSLKKKKTENSHFISYNLNALSAVVPKVSITEII